MLQAPDGGWDLVVCDEAHKMSATVFGGGTRYTKRYKLSQLPSTLTRHFLSWKLRGNRIVTNEFQGLFKQAQGRLEVIGPDRRFDGGEFSREAGMEQIPVRMEPGGRGGVITPQPFDQAVAVRPQLPPIGTTIDRPSGMKS